MPGFSPPRLYAELLDDKGAQIRGDVAVIDRAADLETGGTMGAPSLFFRPSLATTSTPPIRS